MAYFAKIEDGIVTNVIIADQEFIDAGHMDGTWIETTFGAAGGIVYDVVEDDAPCDMCDENTPPAKKLIATDKPCIRKNYAGIGYTYDATRDAFIPPKLDESWVLNENTCLWENN
jgi:hypothetical protein